jgi:hypothetical protein
MRTLLTLFILVIFTSTASARLEEIYEQCVARYGKPVHTEGSTGFNIFRALPFSVIIHFTEGRADFISYRKFSDPTNLESGAAALSDSEIQGFLDLYGTWKRSETSASGPQTIEWQNSDGAIATYHSEKHKLTITTKKSVKRSTEVSWSLDSLPHAPL